MPPWAISVSPIPVYTRPPLDIAATTIKLAPDGQGPTHVEMRTPQGTMVLEIALPGLHNVYNAAAAIGASLAAGLEKEKLAAALANIRPAFGRLEKIQAGDQTIYLSFVKNPTSFNLILRLIAQHPGKMHVLLAASHTIVDGEDFSWLWDVDAEAVAHDVADVVCSVDKR